MFQERFYKKIESLQTSNKEALKKSLLKSKNYQKMKKNMHGLHETLSALQSDPLNAPFFLFADYVEWLEKELKGMR